MFYIINMTETFQPHFRIFIISIVKVISVLKAYIMYFKKMEELFLLSVNAYACTLITNTLTLLFYLIIKEQRFCLHYIFVFLGFIILNLKFLTSQYTLNYFVIEKVKDTFLKHEGGGGGVLRVQFTFMLTFYTKLWFQFFSLLIWNVIYKGQLCAID